MFTDRTAWDAEVLGEGFSLTNIDFENTISSISGGSDWNTTVWTVTAGDVAFSSRYAPLEVIGAGAPYGSGEALYPSHNQPIQIELQSSVYAFGFDLGELSYFVNPPYPPTLSNVVLSNGDVFAGPYDGISFPYGDPSPTYAFFGFSSDLPITSLSMWLHASVEPILDNFTYAQSVPAPEPSTMLLICSGLFGLVASGWRNLRRHG